MNAIVSETNRLKNSEDWNDSERVHAWCAEQHGHVVAYLRKERLGHGAIGEYPAWHVAPYVSLWAIESVAAPGAVGGWVICGDLPTDYISSADAMVPRDAIRKIARRWVGMAEQMRAGIQPTGMTVGSREQWPLLGHLLRARGELLLSWTEDEKEWADHAR